MLRPTHFLAVGGIAVAVLLYWKPIRNYEHVHSVLTRRQGEVAKLQQQHDQLKLRLATVGTGQTLVLEARRLGLVKPGEQLFIVRGIGAWRRQQK